MRTALVVLLGSVALALCWWALGGAFLPHPATALPDGAGDPLPARAPSHVEGSTFSHGDEMSPRREAALPTPAPTEPTDVSWVMQLVGIDPLVPWSSPLDLHFSDAPSMHVEVDDEGVVRFSPDPSAQRVQCRRMEVCSYDDNYRLVRGTLALEPLQQTGRLEIQVQPVAELRGRVLGVDGQGVKGFVYAYELGADGPKPPLLGRAETEVDGSYRLWVTPGRSLLLIAQQWYSPPGPGLSLPGAQLLLTLEPGRDTVADLDEVEPYLAKSEALPATLRCEGVFGAPRELPALRLGAPAELRGRVLLSDGSPLVGAVVTATVQLVCTQTCVPGLCWSPQGLMVRSHVTKTGPKGVFVLRVAPGTPFDVKVSCAAPLLMVEAPSVPANAPTQLELMVPGRLVTLCVVDGERPQPRANVVCGDTIGQADAGGMLQIVCGPQPVSVRGQVGYRVSPWCALTDADSGSVVELPLREISTVAVRIDLRSSPPRLRAHLDWRQLPDGPRFAIDARRFAASEPFVVKVPVGRYLVQVQADDLVPQQLELDVQAQGLLTTLDAVVGGRLTLDVTDATGARLDGRFSLADADGRDVTASTSAVDKRGTPVIGQPGQLLRQEVNMLVGNLPPGRYSLVVEVPSARVEQSIVVEAAKVTEVRLRLQ